MLRYLIGLCLLSSCSLGVVKSGGEKSYAYNPKQVYSIEELKELSPSVISTSLRDPQKGTNAELFSTKQPPLKRIGILVFESTIQPTRSGLANEDKVFLSAQGKQLLTERLLSIWEQSLPLLSQEIDYVAISQIKKSKKFKEDGMNVKDHILTKRDGLAPDDIFFLPKGKKTELETVLNPRGMRDLSLALVPATELMMGPKFSEHAKHTLNEVAKELNLDALLVVHSELHWTSAHTDKHSGEVFPEEAVVKLNASVLVPLSSYHKRLKNIGEKQFHPSTTVPYRTYEARVQIPVNISPPAAEESFEVIERELLTPGLKTYNDLTHMLQWQMIQDLKKTF